MSTLRTDTCEIRVIDGELDTTAELAAPWLRPPVSAIYGRPNRWHVFRSSAFAVHVSAVARGFCMGAVALAVVMFAVMVLRGAAVVATVLGVAP